MLELADAIFNLFLLWQLAELLRHLLPAGWKWACAVVLGLRPPHHGRLWRRKLRDELERRRLAQVSRLHP